VEVTGDWRKYMLRSFMILFSHQTLLQWWNQGRWDWQGLSYIWGRNKMHTGSD